MKKCERLLMNASTEDLIKIYEYNDIKYISSYIYQFIIQRYHYLRRIAYRFQIPREVVDEIITIFLHVLRLKKSAIGFLSNFDYYMKYKEAELALEI